jgi:hypothetical protein
VAEGYDGVVLDVAGPVTHIIEADRLATMAQAAQALLANPAARVSIVD